MSVGNVPIDIVQGEDFTADVVWSDQRGSGIAIAHPCKMVIQDQVGQALITLQTDPETPEGEIPGLNISPDIGLIQIHIQASATAAFPTGIYNYDLFVTTRVDEVYGGGQKKPVIRGVVTVHDRITEL